MIRLLLGGGGQYAPQDRKNALIYEIKKFLGQSVKQILFIPYALKDYNKYLSMMLEFGINAGYEMNSIHNYRNPLETVNQAQAIFIGGGNTFRLLNELYEKDLINILKQKVASGTPYIGISAGSNVVCPSIKTTNDMPIIEPPSFKSLDLIPFQINPHYFDPEPNSLHQGESREKRIQEYHELNYNTVVGMREGSILHIEGSKIYLCGTNGVKVFIRNQEPQEYKQGDRLDILLDNIKSTAVS